MSTEERKDPTAAAPDSVEKSVYGEANHAGKSGPDAADPPRAARKSREAEDDAPPADLEPEEAADVLETRREAHRIKDAQQRRDDEDIITLDTPD